MTAEDRYDSLIQWNWRVAAEKYGFDGSADWRLAKAQVKAESNFNPQAVSPTGARGLLQLMPETAPELGANRVFCCEENLAFGIDYLGRLWGQFKLEQGVERWKFALASYNAGLKHILEAQEIAKARGRPTDQWNEIAAILPELTGAEHAAETIGYVRHIIADYLTYTIKEE